MTDLMTYEEFRDYCKRISPCMAEMDIELEYDFYYEVSCDPLAYIHAARKLAYNVKYYDNGQFN